MEGIITWIPIGSVFGPLFFSNIYINDLSESVSVKSSPILFADSSFIIANRDDTKFNFNTNEIFNEISKWFHTNLLMLNCDKTYFLQFLTKTDHEINMQVLFGNRKIATTQSLKFLGLTVDTSLIWKYHIGELTPGLNETCYAIISIKLLMSLDVLRSTYFSYVLSIISYGIIFWVNSSHSEQIFRNQKKIIRIIMNSSKNASCWQLFKELNILPVQSQYIFSLLLFVTKIKSNFCLTYKYIK